MNLSREAIIILRSPGHQQANGPPPERFTAPSLNFMSNAQWHIRHSTLPERAKHRNPRITLQPLPGGGVTVTQSYQEIDSPAIHSSSSSAEIIPSTTEPNPGEGLYGLRETSSASAFPSSGSGGVGSGGLQERVKHFLAYATRPGPRGSSSHGSLRRQWEILASGKEGQLEDWMIDDGNGWISDSSGERRPDWRMSYVVVYIIDHGEGEEEHGGAVDDGGIEIWDNRGAGRPLSDETVGKIKTALRGVGGDGKFAALVEELKLVRMDLERPWERH
ncbi:hypothetical protein B0H66DRAFT_297837 [Apodospora peruviana]|uniref:Uncharacterized protein n=1 Tax=Apodospora peruviana TaxID=516989 RepID=A0AAE0I0Y1_9PEZI|nr:hypothetical protein B0H66DRAFT_297837 [Apodospora peruviana]